MNRNDIKLGVQIIKKHWSEIALMAVFISVLTLLPFIHMNLGDTYLTTGAVETLTGVPTDEGDKLVMLVRLESDQVVRVRIHRSTNYKQGKIVGLKVVEPKYFGANKYKFNGYVN
ncbi:hypothetical protein [Reinekea sp. G2M2-21]|uniref:hypothetical protein n=1 Tax=Reinekea sp. G2M2-21 TaxID=2788942 RepID=UPI0018A976F6|nr:hypothetical protein [Reinekea sp. G2M2-21]